MPAIGVLIILAVAVVGLIAGLAGMNDVEEIALPAVFVEFVISIGCIIYIILTFIEKG